MWIAILLFTLSVGGAFWLGYWFAGRRVPAVIMVDPRATPPSDDPQPRPTEDHPVHQHVKYSEPLYRRGPNHELRQAWQDAIDGS